jgi:S1-C subfamily serine protease
MRRIGLIVMVALVGACVQADTKLPPEDRLQQPTPTRQTPTPPPVNEPEPAVAPLSANARTEDEKNSIEVFRTVAPAVVFVTNKQLVRDRWTMRTEVVKAGAGTGFLWDSEGHVVTNFHVINKGRSFDVSLYGGKTVPAKFVGGDPRKDLAVLKIETPPGIKPIKLPSTKSVVEVGQKAVAIGNPFGFDHTLTVGVISATGREMKGFGGVTIRNMLQTDASINPGNSGGPLLNSAGELIGVNTMIYSKSGSSSGVGFAVPVETVRRVVPQIIKYGAPRRAGLGVTLVRDEVARANGVKGVVIDSVQRGTPAAKAGLRGLRRTRQGVFIGDVVIGIDKYKVEDYDSLYNALDRFEAGDRVKVHLLRDEKKLTVEVELILLK